MKKLQEEEDEVELYPAQMDMSTESFFNTSE